MEWMSYRRIAANINVAHVELQIVAVKQKKDDDNNEKFTTNMRQCRSLFSYKPICPFCLISFIM